jgi:crotonobetainyl-CoA:carnitine CoA-transferase CaiB-like acyl-CoA transferase
MKAYDALIQAESGLCSVTGPPGQPSKVGASVCDIATGLSAYGEILRALLARGASGRGRHVTLSLFEVMAEWMAVPLAYYEHAGKLLGGTGLDHAQIAPYGAYACADGLIFIVVQNQREWVQLCRDGLGQPELADDPRYRDNMRRVENRAALGAAIEAVFSRYPRVELARRLEAAGIACGRINDVADLARHPALVRTQVTSAGQRVSFPRRVGDSAADARAVPALDQHGAAVRAEFGADAAA